MATQITIPVNQDGSFGEISVIDTTQEGIPLLGKLKVFSPATFNSTTTNQINTAVGKILTEFNKTT